MRGDRGRPRRAPRSTSGCGPRSAWCTRKAGIVGWTTRETLHTSSWPPPCTWRSRAAAVHVALARRRPSAGLVHHSDQGVQYASADDQRLLTAHGLVPSMSRRGDCRDNAVVESFFSTLKSELVTRRWPTRGTAMTALGRYIDGFYNPTRRSRCANPRQAVPVIRGPRGCGGPVAQRRLTEERNPQRSGETELIKSVFVASFVCGSPLLRHRRCSL